MNGIDAGPWREELAAIRDSAVSAVLMVQCSLDWLRPEAFGLRDEIDSAVMEAVRARPDLTVDRIVLHNLPTVGDLPPGEFAALNAAHEDWLYRLATTSALVPDAGRLRIHRLIVGGSQRSVELVDGISLWKRGTQADPGAVAGREILRRSGATTPLTSYDIEMDGPFGDTDPSVYL
jgi:hypothetical protein